jgi:PST family polysaccharide transporter
VIPIIRVLGLSAPISSLGILPSAWFQRELDFKRKVIPETFSAVIGSGLSVLWAYWNWGVWSLVWGKIATESLRTIFYWLASGLKWRPKWDLNEAKQLFQFGSLVSLGSVTAFLYYIVDQTLVGKYMGEKAIGFYSFAFRISTLPVTGLTILLGSVMLPVMSKLQNDAPQLARAVGKNISINALITIPFSIGLFFFGGDLLNLLYGDKWRGAVVLLQILSIYAVLWALIGPLNNVYIARGKAGYFPLIATLKLILAMLAMVWAIPQGNPEAVALAFTLAALICHIYGFYLGARLVQKSIWYLLNFITPYIIGIIPGYLGLKLAEALEMGLVVRMLSFFIPYLGCLLILGREMIKEVTKLVKDTFIAKFA